MKAALTKAAEDVFLERGVSGADVDAIAQRAGLSTGCFYLFFESKEAALNEIIETWLARCASQFESPAAYPDGFDDGAALLDFLVERDVRLYEFVWETRSTLRLLRSCRREHLYLTLPFRAEIHRRGRAWLEQSRRDGLIRADLDLDLAATLMSGAHQELTAALTRATVKPPIERWVVLALETFVRAYGTHDLVAAFERRRRIVPEQRESSVPASGPRKVGEP